MIPLLDSGEIPGWDAFTIRHEPVTSMALMERAVDRLFAWVEAGFPAYRHPVLIAVGPGNNGGDGLGLACRLVEAGYDVTVWRIVEGRTPEHLVQWQKVLCHKAIRVLQWPEVPENETPQTLVIDALLGSGARPGLNDAMTRVVETLNRMNGIRISIDIPTGLGGEGFLGEPAFHADHTLAIQVPKKSFFLPESEHCVGQWEILDIGLHPGYPALATCNTWLLEKEDVAPLLRERSRFAHKGTMGHALLVAGSSGMMGAAMLAAEACLRSGCGKLTVHIPREGVPLLHTRIPEALVNADPHRSCWSEPVVSNGFQALGIGCGTGTNLISQRALASTLREIQCPLVLDADALNALAVHPDWWTFLPPGSILTPHPGEFRRLAGQDTSSDTEWPLLREMSVTHRVIIVLKGAYTRIALPDGRILVNPTGNPGMATAGAGDVLTGILTGMLAQGYPPEQAAMLGVYLHGWAGDLARKALGACEALVAGDIIHHLGHAFHSLHPRQYA
ncbi:MAG: NAD(P)H-hydrate dehydratase [Saprospiraceae bacterium]|nr:NAD(P)H-hydrate dehydratase [Saprospiraceae bacterium]